MKKEREVIRTDGAAAQQTDSTHTVSSCCSGVHVHVTSSSFHAVANYGGGSYSIWKMEFQSILKIILRRFFPRVTLMMAKKKVGNAEYRG